MSTFETLYLIASAAGVDAVLEAMAGLSAAGYLVESSANYRSPAAVLAAIGSADAVVMIDGWEVSPGARAEATFSAALGKPRLGLQDLLPTAA